MADFDTDGDGEISFDEFQALYANAPPGFFAFDYVPPDRLAAIEAHAKGNTGSVS